MYIPRHAQPAPNAILHQPPRQPAYLPARRPREKEKKRKEKKRKEKKRHSTTQQPAGRGRQRHRHRHRQRRPACICVCICICICTSYRTSSTPRRCARRETRPNHPIHPCRPPVLANPRRTGCWPDRARGVHADRQTCSFVATAGRSVGFAGCALFSSALPWKCETCFWLAPELLQACLRRSWRDARCSLACRKLG
jgi:hypothetical protein